MESMPRSSMLVELPGCALKLAVDDRGRRLLLAPPLGVHRAKLAPPGATYCDVVGEGDAHADSQELKSQEVARVSTTRSASTTSSTTTFSIATTRTRGSSILHRP